MVTNRLTAHLSELAQAECQPEDDNATFISIFCPLTLHKRCTKLKKILFAISKVIVPEQVKQWWFRASQC